MKSLAIRTFDGPFQIPDRVIEEIPAAIARGNGILPYAVNNDGVSFYVADDHPHLDLLESRLEMLLQKPVRFSPISQAVIEACLDMYYPVLDEQIVQIQNCATEFRFVCPRLWDSLEPTETPGVRHCPQCNEQVHYCDSKAQLESFRSQRKCVALAIGGTAVCGGI